MLKKMVSLIKKLREIIDVGLDEERIYANFSGKRYAVNVDFDQGLFYFLMRRQSIQRQIV